MIQTTVTEAGTNCLTKAEDAIHDAIGRCEAWRLLAAAYDATDPVSEADGLARVWRDHIEGPADGLAFTTEELEGQGVLAMVTDLKGEEGYQLFFATGQGVTTSQFRVLAVFEMAIPRREQNEGVNLVRRFKNAFLPVVDEVAATLLASKGARWLQAVAADPPGRMADEWDQGEIVGHRMVASIVFTIGPGAED